MGGDLFIDCDGSFGVNQPILDNNILIFKDEYGHGEKGPWEYENQKFRLATNEWSGENLEEWITKIRDAIKPHGYVLNGTVRWQEMYTDDPMNDDAEFGKISICNNDIEFYRGARSYVLVKRDRCDKCDNDDDDDKARHVKKCRKDDKDDPESEDDDDDGIMQDVA